MIRALQIIFVGVLTSFYFFPFEFAALPGINTKMMLAVVGLVLAGWHILNKRSLSIPVELLLLLFFAGMVSLVSLLSITINRTPDTSYVGYIVSFSVWLSAAFAVCCFINSINGRIDVQLVVSYLLAVCVFQCIAALVIDSNPSIRMAVDRTVNQGQDFLHEVNRIYGIGAYLDIAGSRFSAVLSATGFILSRFYKPLKTGTRILYIISFLIIAILGNGIARTTSIGLIIGLSAVGLGAIFRPSGTADENHASSFLIWVGLLGISIVTCVILYNTDPYARHLFRFAFEGFFSLAETGKWQTDSTDVLRSLYVFPETVHTWIIGDGYFMNSRFDINYLGDATDEGYYMGTDVGYLRFIFYFGIIGLIQMMAVLIYSTVICVRHFREESLLFILVLLTGLVIWFKVATDVFLFYALFLSAAALREEKVEPVL